VYFINVGALLSQTLLDQAVKSRLAQVCNKVHCGLPVSNEYSAKTRFVHKPSQSALTFKAGFLGSGNILHYSS